MVPMSVPTRTPSVPASTTANKDNGKHFSDKRVSSYCRTYIQKGAAICTKLAQNENVMHAAQLRRKAKTTESHDVCRNEPVGEPVMLEPGAKKVLRLTGAIEVF